MQTPVVFVIFNRPHLAERVFAEIRKAKPGKLLVIADGPRLDQTEDEAKCVAARAIIEKVDWPCDVMKHYSDVNLGCDQSLTAGYRWVFEQVEEAIILEDDCLPHLTFFPYCEAMLERYRDNERVMLIGGRNSLYGRRNTPYSYYFSRTMSCWGWASWRRAYRHFDPELKAWPQLRKTAWLLDLLGDYRLTGYFYDKLERDFADRNSAKAWDRAWTFSCWLRNSLQPLPNVNLIANIGFGEDATHTTNARSALGKIPVGAMEFPLNHPPSVEWDKEADQMRFGQSAAGTRPFWNDMPRLRHWLRWKLLPSLPRSIRAREPNLAREPKNRAALKDAKTGQTFTADQEPS